jgi:hypothetical protein
MNPIIQHDLMQARIAEMHRQADYSTTARTTYTAMSRIRWWTVGLVVAALGLLAGAPAALATHVPPAGGDGGGTQAAPPPVLNPAAAGGTPGWQIVLIAAGSALVASALTLLAVRAARRATPARPSHS